MKPNKFLRSDVQQRDSERRLEWFKKAKYGMFIHWGLYSMPAGIWKGRDSESHYAEWLQHKEEIPFAEYSQLARLFNPTAFNADEWVQIVRDAGMKYITITSKHHEGFAMFRSKVSNYNIVDATPFRRDPMEELATACDKYDVVLNFYYSQCLDWSHPDAFCEGPRFYPELVEQDYTPDHMRYIEEKVKPQLQELLTQYGKIGAIWFDTPWYNKERMSREYGRIISDHVRGLNDTVLINSRVVDTSRGNEPLNPDLYDYLSLPDLAVHKCALDIYAESPDSICKSYGYDKREGTKLVSAQKIVDRLRMMAEHNGNLLLNVGPTGEGRIPPSAVKRLLAVRELMDAQAN